MGLLDSLLGQQDDPIANEYATTLGIDPVALQKRQRQQSLMQMGLAMMQSQPQRGRGANVLNALGNGLGAAQQGGQDALSQEIGRMLQLFQLKSTIASNARDAQEREESKKFWSDPKNLGFVPEDTRPVIGRLGQTNSKEIAEKILGYTTDRAKVPDVQGQDATMLRALQVVTNGRVTSLAQASGTERTLAAQLAQQMELQGKRAGAATTNLHLPGNVPVEPGLAKVATDTYQALHDEAHSAQSRAQQFATVTELLKGTGGGWGADNGARAMSALRSTAKGLGLDDEQVKALGINTGSLDQIAAGRAFGNIVSMTLRNPKGGEGLPGAMSDADRQFLVEATPGLSQTEQGRALLTQIAMSAAKVKTEQAQAAQRYIVKNPQGVSYVDPTITQMKIDQQPSILTPELKAQIQALSAGVPAQEPAWYQRYMKR